MRRNAIEARRTDPDINAAILTVLQERKALVEEIMKLADQAILLSHATPYHNSDEDKLMQDVHSAAFALHYQSRRYVDSAYMSDTYVGNQAVGPLGEVIAQELETKSVNASS